MTPANDALAGPDAFTVAPVTENHGVRRIARRVNVTKRVPAAHVASAAASAGNGSGKSVIAKTVKAAVLAMSANVARAAPANVNAASGQALNATAPIKDNTPASVTEKSVAVMRAVNANAPAATGRVKVVPVTPRVVIATIVNAAHVVPAGAFAASGWNPAGFRHNAAVRRNTVNAIRSIVYAVPVAYAAASAAVGWRPAARSVAGHHGASMAVLVIVSNACAAPAVPTSAHVAAGMRAAEQHVAVRIRRPTAALAIAVKRIQRTEANGFRRRFLWKRSRDCLKWYEERPDWTR